MSGANKDPGQSDADAVDRRVDQVIDDLAKNLVSPPKVDAIRDAADRAKKTLEGAKRGDTLGRAIRRSR